MSLLKYWSYSIDQPTYVAKITTHVILFSCERPARQAYGTKSGFLTASGSSGQLVSRGGPADQFPGHAEHTTTNQMSYKAPPNINTSA